MTKTVYLHIGTHKTGTTAIQALLSSNEKILKKKGVLYPRSCRLTNNPDLTADEAYAHHRLPLAILDGDETCPGRLCREITSSPCHTAIVSSEVFMERFKKDKLGFTALQALLENFRVKIIIYLRPQDTLYESIYNQQIKDSFVAPPFNPEDLPPYYDYLHWIRLWGQYFGDSNVIVRPYEKAQFTGGSLFSDFLSAIGVDVRLADLATPPRGTNPRLSRDALFFKSLVNQLDVVKRFKNACNGPLLLLSQKQDPHTAAAFREHGLLTPAERWSIRQKYSEQNRRIAREYLGRRDGRLFLAEPPALDDTTAPADRTGLSVESAAAIADELLRALRPDLSDNERKEQLAFEIVKSAVSLLKAKATDESKRETIENLQNQLKLQQRALNTLRFRHADVLYELAHLKQTIAQGNDDRLPE